MLKHPLAEFPHSKWISESPLAHSWDYMVVRDDKHLAELIAAAPVIDSEPDYVRWFYTFGPQGGIIFEGRNREGWALDWESQQEIKLLVMRFSGEISWLTHKTVMRQKYLKPTVEVLQGA